MIDAKEEVKIINALNQFGEYADEPLTDLTKDVCYIEPVNICLIEALTDEAKKILAKFIGINNNKEKPVLEYEDLKAGVGSKYSTEYLFMIFKLFNSFDIPVKIYSKKDYPITIENEHFRVILAPRVATD